MTGTQPGTVLPPNRWYGAGSSSPATASTPMPLAVSIALPPPNPIRPSQRSARYRWTPSVSVVSRGSAAMPSQTAHSRPASDSLARICFTPPLCDMTLSVTMSGRVNPRLLAWVPIVSSDPRPNTMLVGILNANCKPTLVVVIGVHPPQRVSLTTAMGSERGGHGNERIDDCERKPRSRDYANPPRALTLPRKRSPLGDVRSVARDGPRYASISGDVGAG